MFIRIGNLFVDISKISSIQLETHTDQREGTWFSVRIDFDPKLELKAVTLSEEEARRSPFLAQFLGNPGYVQL